MSCYWRSLSSGFGVSLCAPPFIAICDTHARCLLRFESFHHFVLCGYLLPRFESSWVESLMPCCLSREPVFELRQFFFPCNASSRVRGAIPLLLAYTSSPVPFVGGVFLLNFHLSGVLLATFFAPTHDTRARVPRSCVRHHQLLSILSSSARPLDFRCKCRC